MTKVNIKKLFHTISCVMFRAWEWITSIASTHLYAAMLSLIPIVAGISGGAFFSGEYKKIWPFNGMSINDENYPERIINLEGCVFYGSIVMFAALFYLREAAIKYKADKRDKEFLDTIRTMPPKNVMLKFGGLYNVFNEYKYAAINSTETTEKKLNEIEDAIRYGVDTMTNIVFIFMHEPQDTRYAGNIMLYKPISDISEEEESNVIDKLQPFIETRSLNGLAGILDLQRELSSATDKKDDPFSKDEHLKKDIALPIPDPTLSFHNNKKRYLPGAPTALYESYHLINDTHDILESYYENSEYDVAPSIFENIHNYFKSDDGKLVRSFFSIALTGQVGEEKGKLGVINIHCSETNMFGKGHPDIAESYVMLCQPFLTGITELLIERSGLLNGNSQLDSNLE